MIPSGWLVKHIWNGKENKFITLERSKADEYASRFHGTIYPLYEEIIIRDGKEKLMLFKEGETAQTT